MSRRNVLPDKLESRRNGRFVHPPQRLDKPLHDVYPMVVRNSWSRGEKTWCTSDVADGAPSVEIETEDRRNQNGCQVFFVIAYGVGAVETPLSPVLQDR
jgi:hypothetical protein